MCMLLTKIIYVIIFTTQINDLNRSDHKYDVPTGHASFWNHIVDAVDFTEDKLKVPKVTNAHVDTLYKNKVPIKRCVCSNVSINHNRKYPLLFLIFCVKLFTNCI